MEIQHVVFHDFVSTPFLFFIENQLFFFFIVKCNLCKSFCFPVRFVLQYDRWFVYHFECLSYFLFQLFSLSQTPSVSHFLS